MDKDGLSVRTRVMVDSGLGDGMRCLEEAPLHQPIIVVIYNPNPLPLAWHPAPSHVPCLHPIYAFSWIFDPVSLPQDRPEEKQEEPGGSRGRGISGKDAGWEIGRAPPVGHCTEH